LFTAGGERRVCLPRRLTPAVRLFFALVLIGFPNGIRAADEQSGPFLFVSSPRTPKDIEIETRVRRALRQDAQLRPLNLGVHVSGGIARLSGPVPAAQLKQKALSIAGRVDGVLAVSAKELYLSTDEPSGKRLSIRIQEEPPTQTRAASPASPLGNTSPQITLLAPETAAPAVRVPQAARLTANPHPASPALAIAAAIENLRQREARYQQIRARVRDTTVYLFAGDTASEDAMTFAQAVRRLPGVQHVILNSDWR
jgi:hypothetical protein